MIGPTLTSDCRRICQPVVTLAEWVGNAAAPAPAATATKAALFRFLLSALVVLLAICRSRGVNNLDKGNATGAIGHLVAVRVAISVDHSRRTSAAAAILLPGPDRETVSQPGKGPARRPSNATTTTSSS